MGSTRGEGIWLESYFLFLQEQIKGIIIIVREERLDVRDTGFRNLNDWMVTVEVKSITLGGFKGSAYTFIDLISDIIGVGGLLASLGAFAAAKAAILSL